MPRPETIPPAPVTLLEVDFGDAELVVREWPDGAFTLDLNDERVAVSAEQMMEIVGAFMEIGKTKGWT
jgi:hypothetical protein